MITMVIMPWISSMLTAVIRAAMVARTVTPCSRNSLIRHIKRVSEDSILDVVLNHTGNFGEQTLCKEFDRDTDLATQGRHSMPV